MRLDPWQQIRDGMHRRKMDIISSKFFSRQRRSAGAVVSPWVVTRHARRFCTVCVPPEKANHTKLNFFFLFLRIHDTKLELRTASMRSVVYHRAGGTLVLSVAQCALRSQSAGSTYSMRILLVYSHTTPFVCKRRYSISLFNKSINLKFLTKFTIYIYKCTVWLILYVYLC